MKEDTPEPDATADAAEDMQEEMEEGASLVIPPAKETAASVLTRRSNTKKSDAPRVSFVDSTVSTRLVLNRFDLDGDGIISQSEADLMAQENVLKENEKKKYRQFLAITIVLLALTLTANFGLTIATIYLTRQFDVEDGTLVDRSTGKQVTTKANGNIVEATLFGEVDSTGRRLNTNLCFATINMDRDAQDQTYTDFLHGNPITYTTTADGESTSGKVSFLESPIDNLSVDDAESVEFEVDWGTIASYFNEVENILGDLMVDKKVNNEGLVLYAEVECENRAGAVARCPNLGAHTVFFMYCCGTPDQALFDTGNCCLVGEAQLPGPRDMRRLGKCSQ